MSNNINEDPKRLTSEFNGDEIELFDLLLVLWKWKCLIIAGTLVISLVAGIITYVRAKDKPSIYRAKMIIKPATIIKVVGNESTTRAYKSQTPQALASLIESEIKFDLIKNQKNKKSISGFDLSTSIPSNGNNLIISCDAPTPENATKNLKLLESVMRNKFEGSIKAILNEYNLKLERIRKKLDLLQWQKDKTNEKYHGAIKFTKLRISNYIKNIKRTEKQIINYNKRIDELETDLKRVNEIAILFVKKRDEIEQHDKEKDDYLQLLVSIQQNFYLKNILMSQIQGLSNKKYNLEQELSNMVEKKYEIEASLKRLLNNKQGVNITHAVHSDVIEIESKIIDSKIKLSSLEQERNGLQNIQVLNFQDAKILKPNNDFKKYTLLISLTGFFLMVFLSFFIEYIAKSKKNKKNPL